MYSVKPGRGPSLMGCFGAVIACVFAVIWMGGARAAGAPPVFSLFGVVFVVFAIVAGLVSLYNAVGRNRFSTYDITTDEEESDPIAEALDIRPSGREEIRKPEPAPGDRRRIEGDYCPYCGGPVKEEFDFCPKCGKDV